MTSPGIENARSIAREAQTWLDAHPHFHSARRGDVKALILQVRAMSIALEEEQKDNELLRVSLDRHLSLGKPNG